MVGGPVAAVVLALYAAAADLADDLVRQELEHTMRERIVGRLGLGQILRRRKVIMRQRVGRARQHRAAHRLWQTTATSRIGSACDVTIVVVVGVWIMLVVVVIAMMSGGRMVRLLRLALHRHHL